MNEWLPLILLSHHLSLKLKTLLYRKSYPDSSCCPYLSPVSTPNIIRHSSLIVCLRDLDFRFCSRKTPVNKLVSATSLLWARSVEFPIAITIICILPYPTKFFHTSSLPYSPPFICLATTCLALQLL